LGQFLFLPLFNMPPLGKPGLSEPTFERGGDVRKISRPDGTELHVEMYGPPEAQPVVFTHGWTLNSTEWHYVKKKLSDRFRIIVWDLPGLGKSTRPRNNDYSLPKLAADLDAVTQLAGDRRVFLAGHSIGGMTTLQLCQDFPDRLGTKVAGLILIHTTYTNPVKTAMFSGLLTALQKPLIEPLNHLTIALSPLVWLSDWLSYLNGSMHTMSRISSFAGQQTYGQLDWSSRAPVLSSPAVRSRGMLAMLKYDAQSALPRINVPTLVIGGRNDRLTKFEAAEHIARSIPGADLAALAPAGHLGLLEQNDEFCDLVARFIEAHQDTPARGPIASPARTAQTL
jgi:pimeloyl-ACP methyl ester carboxylesterase